MLEALYINITNNWFSILKDIVIMLITVGVAYLIYFLESKRHYTVERNTFSRSFIALLSESGCNHGKIKNLYEDIKNNKNINNIFQTNLILHISTDLIKQPLLYKYSGEEYIMALIDYIGFCEKFNAFANKFSSANYDIERNKEKLLVFLNNVLKAILVLQLVNQHLSYASNAHWGPSTCLKEDVVGWVSGAKNSPETEELEKKLQKLEEMANNKKELSLLRKMYIKYIRN